MYARVSNLAAATALSLVLAALAGCSGPEPDNAPPPPPPPVEAYERAPVDLAGAPPPGPSQDGLAGGPAEAAPAPAVVSMAPIPNPEDLPPAERHRIYGPAYDGDQGGLREDDFPARRAAQPYADARLRPAPIEPSPARPAVVAKAPPKPVVRPAPAKPIPPVVTAAAKPLDPKLEKLQTALAPQISAGATLTLGAPLARRLEGPVVLALPQTLFDGIRQEAAKLGLGRAARAGEITATLSGQGYEITPNGPQIARLKSGEAASFQWQVKPGAGDLGPLRAQIEAVLRGQRTPMTFPLGTITKAAPIPEAAPGGFDLGKLNLGVVVPGLGRMRPETLIGGGLLLLALLLLIAIARNASEAEARARLRRRKARELAEAAAERPVAARPAVKSKASEPKTP
jgi:hypothetical protein